MPEELVNPLVERLLVDEAAGGEVESDAVVDLLVDWDVEELVRQLDELLPDADEFPELEDRVVEVITEVIRLLVEVENVLLPVVTLVFSVSVPTGCVVLLVVELCGVVVYTDFVVLGPVAVDLVVEGGTSGTHL